MEKDTLILDKYNKEDLITLGLFEGDLSNTAVINPDFVMDYFNIVTAYDKLGEQLSQAKTVLKEFIETHNLGSVSSNGMQIKYTSPTTTTSIDTSKLKKEYPDIAALCSKVSPRASSVSIAKE